MFDFLKSKVQRNSPGLDLQNASLSQLRGSIDFTAMKKEIRLGHQQADLSWKRAYYVLRVIWASLSILLLAASLWFTWWLVAGIGSGELIFTGYETFLNIIAGEILLNVLGLVAIVMHFLFPKQSNGKK